MKKTWLILFIISIIFSSCKYQEITVGSPTNLQLKNINTNNIDLSIDLPIKNPNSFSFTIKKVNLDILISNINVGTVSKTEKTKIKANSNYIHTINLSFTPNNILGGGIKLFRELSNKEPDIKVKGYIKVGKFLISKKIKVDTNDYKHKFS